MKRAIFWSIAAFAVAAFGLAIWRFNAAPAGQPLSGETRASFVRSANGACAAQKRSSPDDTGATPDLIARFCECYAETLAKRVSTEDLERLDGRGPADIQAEMKPKIEDADAVCAARLDFDKR